jgi:transposase-like protein
MVEKMLAFRSIEVSHETICPWRLKFGQLANDVCGCRSEAAIVKDVIGLEHWPRD